jgi:hypothetical protein
MTKTACPVKLTGWPWGAGAVPKMRPVAYMTQSSLARLPPMAYKDEKPSLACDMLWALRGLQAAARLCRGRS